MQSELNEVTRTLLQERDLFFISDEFYKKFTYLLLDVVVIPKEEFKKHHIYNSIHANCCYEVWGIEYDFVIVVQAGWYEKQSLNFQKEVLHQQINAGSNMIDNHQLITVQYWQSLDSDEKTKLIQRYDEEVDQVSSLEQYFEKWNGVFPDYHGPNCFAAAMYGVTKNEQVLHEWMHQETFKYMLERNNYIQTEEIEADCVIAFCDDRFQHACYMIDEQYAFNKSGQTFWNPWHVTSFEKIRNDWQDYHYIVFKRHN
ncbi:hypothetical protein [Macrococcus brunensis]|uniref:hypothetical protein n=1 Tax=Macrococcus brunensis TaxID=198483 RepID=UPI001EF12153|nr:hypothetical protein [Macrococcus brunensis]ULG72279.1 hypothetical protein MGG12_01780 [Macrococcus brunensis]